jgi:8-oxo-dGTP pyrophosphatase MutT (NUDIX family)
MKQRAAVVVVKDGCVLLVYRKKNGQEYYVVPGGGVEEGETPEVAAVREAAEELGLTVTLGERLATVEGGDRTEHYFRAAAFEGDPELGGPERDRQSADNVYRLEWVPADRLATLALKPEHARRLCLACLS